MIELVVQEFREYVITTSINIVGCQFYNMNNVLKSDPQWYEKSDMYLNKHLLIENTMFAYITITTIACNALIRISHKSLTLRGPVLFKLVKLSEHATLLKLSQVVFTLQNRVEISMCQVKAVSVCDVCYDVCYVLLLLTTSIRCLCNALTNYCVFSTFTS